MKQMVRAQVPMIVRMPKATHIPKAPFSGTLVNVGDLHTRTIFLFRRLFVTCGVFTRYFFVFFSWLFRGPLLSRKTVFGPFSLLFRGFFVAPVLGKILRVLALEQSSELWRM